MSPRDAQDSRVKKISHPIVLSTRPQRHRSIPAPTFPYRFDGEAGQDMLYLNSAFSSCNVAGVIGENRVSVA
ncbi:MAG: hypothetical protein QOF46_2835 [Paraburkholderia sp.]|nr:hypothetical protein [Paraburkholderia sp.]